VNRVLVTGGAGTIGSAVVRRLLRDPRFEVRVSDQRPAPQWMREGCEVHTGDLRLLDEARRATQGCSHVIHLAAIVGGIANFHKLPHTLTEVNNALYNAVVHAALDHAVQRFTYVSSSMVFERATEYPTTEAHIWECPMPRSAYGFSKLTGEVYVRAAHDQHGLPYTICRPFNAYGPGEMPEDEPGIAHMVPDVIKKCRGPQRGLQHLVLRRADRRRDRPRDLAGLRPRPGRVRAGAPADLRGRRGAALAQRREGAAAPGLGGADRPRRGHRPDRRLAAPRAAGAARRLSARAQTPGRVIRRAGG
jgi:nucleoside-diphosphate-sugar epimerase